ncbi:Flp family type IVb pilin [Comamonas humi]
MMNAIKNFWKDEEGATAIEYGLIAGLIAVLLVTSLTGIGVELEKKFKAIWDALKPATP